MTKRKCMEINTGKTYRYSDEGNGNVFVYAPRRRNYGWRMKRKEFDGAYKDIEVKTETEKWRNRMKKAVKILDENGMWPEVRELYEDLLTSEITLDEKHAASEQYFADKCSDKNLTEKVKRLIEKHGTSAIWDGLSDCKMKSMYFGSYNKETKEMIKSAMESKTKFSTGRIPVNYDVSFEYNPEKNKAWYSEEYKNCGNGHYYLALNNSTAVFCEDD